MSQVFDQGVDRPLYEVLGAIAAGSEREIVVPLVYAWPISYEERDLHARVLRLAHDLEKAGFRVQKDLTLGEPESKDVQYFSTKWITQGDAVLLVESHSYAEMSIDNNSTTIKEAPAVKTMAEKGRVVAVRMSGVEDPTRQVLDLTHRDDYVRELPGLVLLLMRCAGDSEGEKKLAGLVESYRRETVARQAVAKQAEAVAKQAEAVAKQVEAEAKQAKAVAKQAEPKMPTAEELELEKQKKYWDAQVVVYRASFTTDKRWRLDGCNMQVNQFCSEAVTQEALLSLPPWYASLQVDKDSHFNNARQTWAAVLYSDEELLLMNTVSNVGFKYHWECTEESAEGRAMLSYLKGRFEQRHTTVEAALQELNICYRGNEGRGDKERDRERSYKLVAKMITRGKDYWTKEVLLTMAYIKVATALRPLFKKKLEGIFTPSKVKIAPIKSVHRCVIKSKEYSNGCSMILDYLRAAVLCDTIKETVDAVEQLDKNFKIVRVKDRMLKGAPGNKAFLINLVVTDDDLQPSSCDVFTAGNNTIEQGQWWSPGKQVQMICEVQVTIAKLFVNDKQMHLAYEVARCKASEWPSCLEAMIPPDEVDFKGGLMYGDERFMF